MSLVSLFGLLLATNIPAQAGVQMNFQYLLSDFSGPVSSQWAQVTADMERGEIYAFDPHENQVRIFNEHGMEIFSFGEDGQVNGASDIAVAEDGSIYILSTLLAGKNITKLNYRGEPVVEIELENLPEDMQDFRASQLKYTGGSLYLLDADGLKILVVSTDGHYQAGYDLRSHFDPFVAELEPEKRKSLALDISGFSVDKSGNIYFTTPALFTAFRLNVDGTIEDFGKAGSGPGKFGVVAGIAADGDGNIFVSDRLRSVVMAFDKSFNFLSEFGYRGTGAPENLVVPDDIVLDNNDKIYVSQGAGRGVSCFQIIRE